MKRKQPRFPNLLLSAVLIPALLLAFAGCGGDQGESAEATEGGDARAADAGNAGAGTKILETEIPPEDIQGTPMPIEAPNLQQAPSSAPKIAVPEGTELLSLNKPVTSSDDFPIIGEVSYVTDGDKLAGEGYYVELMNGLQWVQIDLEASAEIHAVWIWHFHSQARAYQDVIVQVSDDPNFESGVTTLFNNDYDNSAGVGKGSDQPYVESRFGKLVPADGVTGRFVRCYSKGNTSNDMNHYIEVEVYGIPQG